MIAERRGGSVLVLSLMMIGAGLSFRALADPLSDFFEPDVLRTGAALAKRTPGLADPLGRTCAEPVGALTLPEAIDHV